MPCEPMEIRDARRFDFCMVQMEVVRDRALSAYDKAVYLALCSFASLRDGSCFPSVGQVAELAGCSARKVHESLSVLEGRGYLARRRQVREDGGRTASLYVLVNGPGGAEDRGSRSTPCASGAEGGAHDVQRGSAPGAEQELEPKELEPRALKASGVSDPEAEPLTLRGDAPTLPKPSGSRGRKVYSPEFEVFWQAYHPERRDDKPVAFRCWNARLREGADPGVLVGAAAAYVTSCRAQGTEARFVQLPTTFLGPGERWRLWADRARGRRAAAEEQARHTTEGGVVDAKAILRGL